MVSKFTFMIWYEIYQNEENNSNKKDIEKKNGRTNKKYKDTHNLFLL